MNNNGATNGRPVRLPKLLREQRDAEHPRRGPATLHKASPREAAAKAVSDASDAFALVEVRRGVDELMQALEHDPEARAHAEKTLEDKQRAEIAAELGCTVEHVDAVRRRVDRAVAALAGRMKDDGGVQAQKRRRAA